MKTYFGLILLTMLGGPFCTRLHANVETASIFSDHAVLQKSPATTVWGWADPGEQVSVSLAGAVSKVVADSNGNWRTALDLGAKGPGPYEMTIQGKNRLVFSDVLIGEVWICSGQSNMQMQLLYTLNSETEIARSANPLLRQFAVRTQSSLDPLEKVGGTWSIADPKTSGAFSAIGYYFGKTLQLELNTPVAVIYAAVPGTGAAGWMSAKAGDRVASIKAEKDKLFSEVRALPERLSRYRKEYTKWANKYNRGYEPPHDVASYNEASAKLEGWEPVNLPGKVNSHGLSDSGFVWLRKTINVPEKNAGKKLRLVWDERNPVFGTVYWNGEQIDEMTPESLRRVVPWEKGGHSDIPASSVKSGNNTVAIRIYSPVGNIELLFSADKNPLMTGEWLAKVERKFSPVTDEIRTSYPGIPPFRTWDDMIVPTFFYNGMIHPILPLTVQGVAWYQGEADVHHAYGYREQFSILIDDWREGFGKELPFYFCQLPNNSKKTYKPQESKLAELRESQFLTLSKPKTGMAVLIDGRDPALHPRDKEKAGIRLAKACLSNTYGIPGLSSGPRYQSMEIDGDKVYLTFSESGGTLVAAPLGDMIVGYEGKEPVTEPVQPILPSSELQGFAICGEDMQWKWAQATIEGNEVIVFSPNVPKPVAVRYAWADNPTCNLYNKAGFPAPPFRTDTFLLSTQGR